MWSRIERVHHVRSLHSNGSASCRLTNYWGRRYSPTNCNCAEREFEIDRSTDKNGNGADMGFEIDRLTVWATRSSCCRTVGSRGNGVLAVARRPTLLSPAAPERHLQPRYHHLASSVQHELSNHCLLYTSPSPRDKRQSRMPSSA